MKNNKFFGAVLFTSAIACGLTACNDDEKYVEPTEFNVTYYSSDSTTVITTATYNAGDVVNLDEIAPATDEREGYIFKEWSLCGEVTMDKDIKVYALADMMSFTVKFYDVEGNPIESATVYYGMSAVAPNVEIDEYYFNGWKLNGEIVDVATYKVRSDVDFVADYTEHEFHFNSDGTITTRSDIKKYGCIKVSEDVYNNLKDDNGWRYDVINWAFQFNGYGFINTSPSDIVYPHGAYYVIVFEVADNVTSTSEVVVTSDTKLFEHKF